MRLTGTSLQVTTWEAQAVLSALGAQAVRLVPLLLG